MYDKDYTVDFILRLENGDYLCKNKINKPYKSNHLNATPFSTRKDAEATLRVLRLKAVVMKRCCTLEY